MLRTKRNFSLILSLLTLFLCSTASSVVIPLLDIDGTDSGWEAIINDSGCGFPVVYAVNNDSVIIELDKTFSNLPVGNAFSPINIEFRKVAVDAVHNIIIDDEYIINNTSVEWTDYEMHLLLNPANPQAAFDQYETLPDGHQFESVHFENFHGLDYMPATLHFVDTDGLGVTPTSPDNIFQPGYLGGHIVIITNPGMQAGDSFTLSQQPSIPEPASFTLFSLAAVFFYKKKKEPHSRFHKKYQPPRKEIFCIKEE